MAWNGSVRTHYNQIAQGGEQDNLFFALGFLFVFDAMV